jgi:hypothetical protein
MTNTNDISSRQREVERDARALAKFSGMKYTRALRLIEHPLAQGILGERFCARDVIRVLTEHPVLSRPGADPNNRSTHLGSDGLWSAGEYPLEVSTEDDYLSVVLTAEVLRMFNRTAVSNSDASSYGLKHTAEEFLGEYLQGFSYITNGTAIWAAAVLDIPVAPDAAEEQGPNADFGLVSEQVDYARRMRRSAGAERERVRAHHHRPPGYAHLRRVLEEYAESGKAPERWGGIDDEAEPTTSPFHEWLAAQAGPGELGSRALLAGHYRAGFRDGDHGVAKQPEDLISILRNLGADEAFIEAGHRAVVEWGLTSPESIGIRTERMYDSRDVHGGWGAGSGDAERYEYRCPCGHGKIVEEHDNVPGFREHDHFIICGTCTTEWRFVDGLPTRSWRIEPIRVG